MRSALLSLAVLSVQLSSPLVLAGGTPLAGELVASGLASPVHITCAPGDSTRLLVVERGGRIRLIKNGVLQSAPFLDFASQVSTSGERGFLGLAFHPNYQSNGFLYVRYSDLQGESTVARYTVSANPDFANSASQLVILEIPVGTSYHNGGSIAFGADGYLYIGTGDGASMQNAQNTGSWLGKILRIDVNGDDFPEPNRNYRIPPGNPFVSAGLAEVWAYGLRNPFRFSFDRQTGALWIGDVGQGTWEEVSFQPAGLAGRNYGWPCREAAHCTKNGHCNCNSSSLTDPVWEYTHIDYGCAITGGVVYRGCAIPDLQGTYFCADYCTSRIFSFRYSGGAVTDFTLREGELDPPGSPTINNIVGFGEDFYGEIYICDLGGEIFKIVPAQDPPDGDGDGVPDACEPPTGNPADINGDGSVDVNDLLILVGAWGPCPPNHPADIAPVPNGDQTVDVNDLLLLVGNWG